MSCDIVKAKMKRVFGWKARIRTGNLWSKGSDCLQIFFFIFYFFWHDLVYYRQRNWRWVKAAEAQLSPHFPVWFYEVCNWWWWNKSLVKAEYCFQRDTCIWIFCRFSTVMSSDQLDNLIRACKYVKLPIG